MAGAGRAGHRRARPPSCASWPSCSAGADRAMMLTARGAEQHARAPTPCRPGSTWRWRWAARHAGLRLRLPDRPGQRAGRPRARAEGRPAARLPEDRRPGRPRARGRGVGRRPRSAARPGALGVRAARRARHRRRPAGAAGVRLQPGGLRAERQPRRRAARALDLLVVADFVLSETAALADVVLPVTQWAEEDGTMTNLEGRVILREQAVEPPRRGAHATWRCSPGSPSGSGSPVAVHHRPRGGLRRAGRASAGGRADYAGITYDRIRAEDGVFWPCPAAGHPGTPRLFLDRFAHPDGRARFVAVEHRGPPSGRRRLPAVPDHRAGARAVPVRRPDPPGPRARPTTGRSSSCTRCWPPASARRRRAGRWSPPGAASSGPGPGGHHDPAGHRLRAVPLGRRQPAHQRRAGPGRRMPEFKVCAAAVTRMSATVS